MDIHRYIVRWNRFPGYDTLVEKGANYDAWRKINYCPDHPQLVDNINTLSCNLMHTCTHMFCSDDGFALCHGQDVRAKVISDQ